MHQGHHGHLKSDDSDITTVKIKVALGAVVPPCCIAAGFSPVTKDNVNVNVNLHTTLFSFFQYFYLRWKVSYLGEIAGQIFEKYLKCLRKIVARYCIANRTWQIKVRYYFSNTYILTSVIFHPNYKILNTRRLQNLCSKNY